MAIPSFNYKEFKKEWENLSIEDFRDKFPDPFLVIESFGEAQRGTSATMINLGGKDSNISHQVYYLDKNLSNTSGMFGIGRNKTNEICIAVQGMSKFHAYIKRGYGGEESYISDTDSVNGTKLNGTKCGSRRRYKLTDGDEILFAENVVANYHTNDGMYQRLKVMAF